jgi:hypothetical protein
LWVIDDKDLAESFTPAEFARGVRQFYDARKGEIAKLRAKVEVISVGRREVAETLGVQEPAHVQGLFVTRRPIPAAFTSAPTIMFVTLRGLESMLLRDPA